MNQAWGKNFKTLCLLMVLVLIGLAPVYAGGAKEDPIEEAKILIEQKDFEKAYILLASVINEYPDRRDDAEALLRQIRGSQTQNTGLMEDLINTLEKEPENSKKSLALINQMLSIDPSPRNKQKLENYRIIVQLQEDRAAKNRIMQAARDQLARDDYMAALKTYLSGFTLQREDFLLGIQKQDFKDRTIAAADAVSTGVTSFEAAMARLQPLLDSFTRGLADNTGKTDVQQEFTRMAASYLDTVQYPVLMENSRQLADRLWKEGDKDYPKYAYNEYVRFLQEFLAGPANSSSEGIAWTARKQIDTLYQDSLSGLEKRYQEAKTVLDDAFAAKDWARTLAGFDTLQSRGHLYARALALRSGKDPGLDIKLAGFQEQVGKAFSALPNTVLLDLEAYRVQRAALLLQDPWLVLKKDFQSKDYAKALDFHDQSLKLQSDWAALLVQAKDLEGMNPAVTAKATRIFDDFLKNLSVDTLSLARSGYLALAGIDLKQIKDPHSGYAARYAQALRNQNGVMKENKITYHYPDEALKAFTALETDLQAWSTASLALDARTGSQRQEIRTHAPVVQTSNDNLELKRTMDQELAELRSRITAAKDTLKRSQELRTQAEQTITAGRANLETRRLNLDRADKAWDDAYRIFFDAYDLAWNDGLRAQSDALLSSFKQDIENARQLVIQDKINALIDTARASFDQELYGPALDSIAEAEDLFKQTTAYKLDSKARNQEIVYLKGRIIAANTLSQDRAVSESDPEYPQVSGYLRKAAYNYYTVKTAMGDAKRPDAQGLKLIEEAKGYLANIVLLKPNNWEAKLLQLKLDQLADAEDFRNRFKNRADDAIKTAQKTISDRNVTGAIASLTDLNVLQEINPGYPGMVQTISRVRIFVGLDPNPVDVANRDRSRRLTDDAIALSNTKDTDTLNRALAILNNALELDQDNTRARNAARDIRRKMGGISAILTQEDEILYRQAEAFFNDGNFIQAGAITARLLAKPGNNLYEPLVKLAAKINAQ